MACKLVAIYQKHYDDAGETELTNDKINGFITTPLKYYAKFDFTRFGEGNLEEERDMQDEGQESWNPQDSLVDEKVAKEN